MRSAYRGLALLLATGFPLASGASATAAQDSAREPAGDTAAVIAVAEAALVAITNEDMAGFAALMLPEAVTFSVAGQGGPPGRPPYTADTRQDWQSLDMDVDIVERGFDPDVRIAGDVALLWLPYDLYIDGAWSHCGVDTFTMVRTAEGWRIAAMAWTVEQPPACRPHPDGPPGGG